MKKTTLFVISSLGLLVYLIINQIAFANTISGQVIIYTNSDNNPLIVHLNSLESVLAVPANTIFGLLLLALLIIFLARFYLKKTYVVVACVALIGFATTSLIIYTPKAYSNLNVALTSSHTQITFKLNGNNETSDSETITLQNLNFDAIRIYGIYVSNDFILTHTCGESLIQNSSCDITVAYKKGERNPPFPLSPTLFTTNPTEINENQALDLHLLGEHFKPETSFFLNNTELARQFVNDGDVLVTIPANLAQKGTAQFTAHDYVGNSNTLNMSVLDAPSIELESLAPNHIRADGIQKTITLIGRLFTPNTTLSINNVIIPSTFISTTQISFVTTDEMQTTVADYPIQVHDSGQDSTILTLTTIAANTPPENPQAFAPPLPTTATTHFYDTTKFLFEGSHAVQFGLDPKDIDPKRTAVFRGRVLDRANQPLAGVKITIKRHPELGYGVTRSDGRFDMVVNGGGYLTLNYTKEGYLPIQRQTKTPWRDYVNEEDVIMIPYDTQVTLIDLNSTQPIQVARGSIQTDADGSRQATIFFSQGTTATMVMPSGTTQPLSTLHVRATEYTVGENGPQAMPGPLPPESAYTYAVELSADEAVNAGAKSIRFSQPVFFYIDNFLNFPTGERVPAGWYDLNKTAWMPSNDGRIIEILSITTGLAELDIDGSGNAADSHALAELGITEDERAQLAKTYAVGKVLWRTPVSHFTPWDCNFPWDLPRDATIPPKNEKTVKPNNPSYDATNCGCVVKVQNQILGEDIPIVGTPFNLHYRSDRTVQRADTRILNIPLSKSSVPASLLKIKLKIEIAGRVIEKSFTPAPNLSTTYQWDGLDIFGRRLSYAKAKVTVSYIYPIVYYRAGWIPGIISSFARRSASFSLGKRIGSVLRSNITHRLADVSTGVLRVSSTRTIGVDITWYKKLFSNQQSVIQNWSISPHHHYNPISQTLFKGDGSKRTNTSNTNNIITIFAGGGTTEIVEGTFPAKEMRLNSVRVIEIAPDGNVYFVEQSQSHGKILKINSKGMMTTIAGLGQVSDSSGDGGSAINATLGRIRGISLAEDGSIYLAEYLAESYNARIRKITPEGIINTVFGTGTKPRNTEDGILATEASVDWVVNVQASPDDGFYVIGGNTIGGVPRYLDIIKVNADGRLRLNGDRASISNPIYITMATDGVIYISGLSQIYKIGLDGKVSLVIRTQGVVTGLALTPEQRVCYSTYDYRSSARIFCLNLEGDPVLIAGSNDISAPLLKEGDLSTEGRLGNFIFGLAISPDGDFYFAGTLNYKPVIFKVSSALPSFSATDIAIPSEDGSQLFRFTAEGRHLDTTDTTTGKVIYRFAYTPEGDLATITDIDGEVTTIQRDASGNATAIIAPDGQITHLTLDANGYLASISNPNGETDFFKYTSGGLLTKHTDPRANFNLYGYDSQGLFISDLDAVGGGWALNRVDDTPNKTNTVSTTSGEGRISTYTTKHTANGDYQQINTKPDGTQTINQFNLNHSETTDTADGMHYFKQYTSDPRLGALSPTLKKATLTTPAGLTRVISATHTAVLADPNNKLSHTSLTDTITINGKTTTRHYDRATNTWTTTSPEGRISTSKLTPKGRLMQSHIPDLADVDLSYTTQGRLATLTQNDGTTTRDTLLEYYTTGPQKGLLQKITNAESQIVQFEYDNIGQITKQTLPDGREILTHYDANGNVTTITPPSRPEHQFAYTPMNLGHIDTPPTLASITNPITTRDYNKDKQLELVTRPDGQMIDFIYDNTSGKLNTITIPRGNYNYTYDPTSGKLNQITSPNADTLSFSYDGSLPLSTTWAGTINGKVSKTYNNDFILKTRQINSETPINFAYDNDLLLIQAGKTSLTRDPGNGLIKQTQLTDGTNNTTTTRGHNGFAELSSLVVTHNANALYETSYTRDKLGRITHKTENLNGTTTDYDYVYDLAGRLIKVDTNGITTATYGYDDNSNRTHLNGSLIGSYDDQDRQTQYNGIHYTYTDNGELKTKTQGAQITQYHYDVIGNLIDVTLPDNTAIEYLIDGRNRRVGKKRNGVLEQAFLYKDKLNPIAELDANSHIVSQFIYASRSNIPDYMEKGGKTYRIIADHLGSPRLVVELASGVVVQQMDYDVWGKVTLDTNPGFQPFGFAGGIYDQDTELTRFGARDYDASVGRWTVKDPIGFDGGLSNLYGYVGGDPVNFVDLEGLICVTCQPDSGGGNRVNGEKICTYHCEAGNTKFDVKFPAGKEHDAICIGQTFHEGHYTQPGFIPYSDFDPFSFDTDSTLDRINPFIEAPNDFIDHVGTILNNKK